MPTADTGPKSFLTNQPQNNNDARTKMFSTSTSNPPKKSLSTGFKYETSTQPPSHKTLGKSSINPPQAESSFDQIPGLNNQKPQHPKVNKLMEASSTLNIDKQSKQSQKNSQVKNSTNGLNNRSLKLQQNQKVSPLIDTKFNENIIDIPDSPFDQLVPDYLLIQSSTSMNNLNQHMYQDVEPESLAHSKTKHREQMPLVDCQKQTIDEGRGFSLVDESLFEDENQLVPEKSTSETSLRDIVGNVGCIGDNVKVAFTITTANDNYRVVPSSKTPQQKVYNVSDYKEPSKGTAFTDEEQIFPRNEPISKSGTVHISSKVEQCVRLLLVKYCDILYRENAINSMHFLFSFALVRCLVL